MYRPNKKAILKSLRFHGGIIGMVLAVLFFGILAPLYMMVLTIAYVFGLVE